MRKVTTLAVVSLLASTVALGQTFEDSCQNPAANGCDLASDQLIFGRGGAHEIVAHIRECFNCTGQQPDGSFTIDATAEVEFGPYDPALCNPDDDTWDLILSAEELIDDASGGAPALVPYDPTRRFIPQPELPRLDPACVRAGDLGYEIPEIFFTGDDGGRTGGLESGEMRATLPLHPLVRARDATGLLDAFVVEAVPIAQDLSFDETRTPPAAFEVWPEGFPFRLDPGQLRIANDGIDLLFGAGTPYRWQDPAADGVVTSSSFWCGNIGCAYNWAVHNAGYLAHPDWSPSLARIQPDGLDVELALAAGDNVVFETVFPRGFYYDLGGGGQVSIADSRLAAGSFAQGSVTLKTRIDPCDFSMEPGTSGRRFAFLPDTVRVQADGSILGAIEDLELDLLGGSSRPIAWAITDGTLRNEATGLGCGSFYAPAPFTDASPQLAWYASGVPDVLGRGLYPGINYNRSQVCADGGGQPTGALCTSDADCDTGAGESCVDGGFSPFCPDLTGSEPTPHWTTPLEGQIQDFPIDPDLPAHSGREMAFFLRQAGVTGVFDGGDDPISRTMPAGFDLDLDSYGLAFERSESERGDTIVAGGVAFGWPSDTNVPFDEMTVCNCGALGEARAPDQLVERELAYWDQTFYPYGLSFTDNSLDDCALEAATCQDQQTIAAKACIQARTPIHRFAPDPDSVFGIAPDPGGSAQPDRLTPYSHGRLDFDEDLDASSGAGQQPGWEYHPESFAFSSWAQAGSPGPGQGFGYIDAGGDLELPFFGLTPTGVRVGIDSGVGFATADVHAECDEVATPGCAADPATSYTSAGRKMAADSVASNFRVDYLRPGATSDPADGLDEPGRGRGTMFAFADCNDFDQDDCGIDLGSAVVNAALIMQPDTIVGGQGDLGAGAALRLYTNAGDKNALAAVLSPGRRQPALYAGALAALGIADDGGPSLPARGQDLHELLHATGAIHELIAHPDSMALFNVEGEAPGLSPPMNGSKVSGYLDFSSPAGETLDAYLLSANVDTGGDFFAMEASLLTVDRHAHEGEEPIQEFSKESRAGASNNMDLPSEQSVPFPDSGGSRGQAGVENDFMSWVLDFDMPAFEFKSLTGSIDLTKAGLAAVGIDKMGMTMKFYADGDWYLSAGMDGNFDGYRVRGDTLFGATKDMTPLADIDAEVAAFLEGIDRFDGGFVTVGVGASIINYGCLLRLNGGLKVGGWYISGFVGGRINAQAYGTAICLIDIKASLTLMGMTDFDAYKIGGNFWLGGGIGSCEPDDWETPEDVMNDDWCAACVGYVGMTGESPPEDIEFNVDGPDFDCKFFF
jgi:hypothetical protein